MGVRSQNAIDRTAEQGIRDRLAGWYPRAGDIVAQIDSDRFAEVLDDAIMSLVQFDLSCIFSYPDEKSPILLHDGFRGYGTGRALQNYLRGTYLLDAFYIACAAGVRPGLYRLRDLAPDEFLTGEYYNSWEVHPCISMDSGSLAEEIAFLVPVASHTMAAYSLMRSNRSRPFSADEFDMLNRIEPVVRQAIVRHFGAIAGERPETQQAAWSERGQTMERAFETFAPECLTVREQMIVRLILRGHSTMSVAQELGITEGTAKNHRKSIYAKLAISTQSELFLKFIAHILT